MTFKELLHEIRTLKGGAFPDTAVREFPVVISERVQQEIMTSGKSIEETADIFIDAFEEVNRGSRSKLETLIEKRLR